MMIKHKHLKCGLLFLESYSKLYHHRHYFQLHLQYRLPHENPQQKLILGLEKHCKQCVMPAFVSHVSKFPRHRYKINSSQCK